jgi:hypothetical protein
MSDREHAPPHLEAGGVCRVWGCPAGVLQTRDISMTCARGSSQELVCRRACLYASALGPGNQLLRFKAPLARHEDLSAC